MSDITTHAKALLDGITPGPWVMDDHEDNDYDTITVGAGEYLTSPGMYRSTDLIHEVDTYGIETTRRTTRRLQRMRSSSLPRLIWCVHWWPRSSN